MTDAEIRKMRKAIDQQAWSETLICLFFLLTHPDKTWRTPSVRRTW